MTDEELWRRYVLAYDIEVSQERVEEELRLIRADLKHRMMYEQMSGGELHAFPDMELEGQRDEILEAAVFEAKELSVLRDLASKLDVTVTADELLAHAEGIARREGSTVEMLRRFFGDDLSVLERDVRDRKIREWAVAQMR